jgi:accessory gene regulator B
MFIGGVYVCEYIFIPFILKVTLALICILLIFKYAPADTEKRPIINKKRRKMYKVLSILLSGIFSILIVIFSESLVSNYLLLGLVFSTLMILPISYKLFDLPYDNYKRYSLSEV